MHYVVIQILRAIMVVSLSSAMLTFARAQAQTPADTVSCPGMETGLWTLRPTRKIPLLKSQAGPGAVLLYSTVDGKTDELSVNSDGSPRAYHLLDPHGKYYALNDMSSGGVQVWENGNEIKYDDRSLPDDQRTLQNARYYDVFNRMVRENKNFGASPSTYKPANDTSYQLGDDFGNKLDPPPVSAVAAPEDLYAYLGGWKPPEVALEPVAAPSKPASNLRCLQCKETSCQVCFKDDIVKFNADEICIRKTGRYAGFLVNQTGLDADAGNLPDPENAEDHTCDTPVNLDPEKLPGLVLPDGQFAPDGTPALTAHKGDIVVGFNPDKTKQKWVFGIVSDGGPSGKFGEASIAFNRVLDLGYEKGSKHPRPSSYDPTLQGPPYQVPRPIGFLILPGTKQKFKKWSKPDHMHEYDFSPQTVASTAKTAFLEWAGTTDMNLARDKFRRCLALLPPN